MVKSVEGTPGRNPQGAGIFVLTGIAAGVAGPGLIITFILNGLVALLTAFSYAELGSCFHSGRGRHRLRLCEFPGRVGDRHLMFFCKTWGFSPSCHAKRFKS